MGLLFKLHNSLEIQMWERSVLYFKFFHLKTEITIIMKYLAKFLHGFIRVSKLTDLQGQ